MFSQLHNPIISPIFHASNDSHLEVNRLLATAVVNIQFRDRLLNEPEAALENGYLDTPFMLTSEERALILSIHTDSLPELAKRLLAFFNEQPIRVSNESCSIVQ